MLKTSSVRLIYDHFKTSLPHPTSPPPCVPVNSSPRGHSPLEAVSLKGGITSVYVLKDIRDGSCWTVCPWPTAVPLRASSGPP